MTSTKQEIHHAKEMAQLERSLRTLAENAKWLDEYRDRTVQAAASVRQPQPVDQPPRAKTLAHAGRPRQ